MFQKISLKIAHYLREIVYGGSDGIITTFAVVAGFSGAGMGDNLAELSFMTVLLFGFASLFADGASMGIGSYLSIRSQRDVYDKYKALELEEIRSNIDAKKQHTVEILKQKGFSNEYANIQVDCFGDNHDYWADFLVANNLDIPNPEKTNPYLTGLVTFTAFILFGGLTLLPYMFLAEDQKGLSFIVSSLLTIGALSLLGIMRWKLSQIRLTHSLAETVLVGSISAVVAFVVGRVIG